MNGSVVIDCFPESAHRYRCGYAIVVIDVIRATTTATTAVSLGRRVFPVQTTDEAFVLAGALTNPLLVGELGGNMPYGFEMTNSPAQVAGRQDINRPMILVSSSGTQLLLNARGNAPVFVACFRNLSAVACHLSGRYEKIALLGAGTRGQFRREDQMGCAWIAEKLVGSGYEVVTPQTAEYIGRWVGASPQEVRGGRSAEYLRRSGQEHDLEFILNHVDDLGMVPALLNGEIISMPTAVNASLQVS
jgi:2-phosphosulfolactate phosphatase